MKKTSTFLTDIVGVAHLIRRSVAQRERVSLPVQANLKTYIAFCHLI